MKKKIQTLAVIGILLAVMVTAKSALAGYVEEVANREMPIYDETYLCMDFKDIVMEGTKEGLRLFPKEGLSTTKLENLQKENIDYGKNLTEYGYFEDIYALDEEIMKELKEIYLLEHPEGGEQALAGFPSIDYEDAIKVYINTGIHNVSESDQNVIMEWLSKSDYVWVLPLEFNGENMQVTLARGKDLSEELVNAATEEERETIDNREGNWKVSEIAIGRPDNYREQMENLGEDFDTVVFVGGIPGVQYPVALGFKDGEAQSFVSIGYSQGILEEGNVTYSKKVGNVMYDFKEAMEQMQSYDSTLLPSGGGAGGATVDMRIVYLTLGTIALVCAVTALYYRRKNKL